MAGLKSCIERLDNGHLCGELSNESRCEPHRRVEGRRRNEREPWTHFYTDPRWTRARLKILARDDNCCTFERRGHRCENTAALEVHHDEKLRHIWIRFGRPQRGTPSWDRFVRAACDLRKLRTLCHTCHKIVDNAISKAQTGTSGPERPPLRRQARAGRRGTQKKRSRPADV